MSLLVPFVMKLFSNVAGVGLLEPSCVVGPVNDLKFRAVKLEMNYSANQKRHDWRLGGFQSNTPSTEVINLLCWNRKIRKTFFRVTFKR